MTSFGLLSVKSTAKTRQSSKNHRKSNIQCHNECLIITHYQIFSILIQYKLIMKNKEQMCVFVIQNVYQNSMKIFWKIFLIKVFEGLKKIHWRSLRIIIYLLWQKYNRPKSHKLPWKESTKVNKLAPAGKKWQMLSKIRFRCWCHWVFYKCCFQLGIKPQKKKKIYNVCESWLNTC